MNTYLECYPCFLRQALEASRLAGLDEPGQKRVMDRVLDLMRGRSAETPPPLMGQAIHRAVAAESGKHDPYKEVKHRSNREALEFLGEAREMVLTSEDPLASALVLSAGGNLIDFAVRGDLNVSRELRGLLQKLTSGAEGAEAEAFGRGVEALKERLTISRRFMILADNAGEIVFDRLLLETLRSLYPEMELVLAVRGGPAINDALYEDAEAAGATGAARVISSGCAAPGTDLEQCSQEFLEEYRRSDLILSKGQGNYEMLNDADGPLFFLLTVKCPAVSGISGHAVGAQVLLSGTGLKSSGHQLWGSNAKVPSMKM